MILKNDINVKLVFLILIVISAIVLITMFYLGSFDRVLTNYRNVDTKLNQISNNLTITQQQLGLCHALTTNLTAELTSYRSLQEKSREEYSKIYEQTEGELTSTQSVLASTKADYDQTKADLTQKTSLLNTATSQLEQLKKNYNDLSSKYDSLKKQSEDYEQVNDNLKDCQANHAAELSCYQSIATE